MAAPSQIDLIAIVQCQAYVRGFLERRNYKWIKSVRETRHRTVKEIYSTELTYRENLTYLMEAFKKPLEEDANGPAKMVTKDDVRLMFSEIPVMVLYSNQLITDLENNVMKNWNDHIKIGTIFLKMLKFFKGYSQYVNVYERARDQIAKLRATNARFAAFLRERETQNGVMTPLENYLITPVQRIPRYELLLHALVNNTWKSHPDYQNLVEAHKMAAQISEQVNDMKRQRENHDKMLQVYNLLTIGKKEHWDKQLLVEKKTRVFVREGTVTESMIKGEQTKFFALLFNDLLLWTKPKKNGYEFKASNDLKNAKVELKSGSVESTIHLRCEGSMRVFKGETEDDTQRWFTSLKACINNQGPDGLQITTSTSHIDPRPMKADKSNPALSTSGIDKARASKLAKDERRKPRGIRSTQLKLSELRFLDDIERSKTERTAEQIASIRQWQTTPDRADLARFEVSESQVSAMFTSFGPDTYKSFFEMTQSLSALSLHQETPEIVLLGRQGSGKTSLLNALLGYSLPLDDLRRPLFIHLITNMAHPPEAPLIWIRKDYAHKPRITKDVHVSSPDQLAKELLKRASKEYTEVPIHMFFEASHVLSCTLIDTPGLDAFQFHDDAPASALPSNRSLNAITVRSLVYEVARHPHRHLVFVEECKHKGLMMSASGLATVVDPHLTRSTFVNTKFHHELRDMWQHTQLNAYFHSVPNGSFFVTLPTTETMAAAANAKEAQMVQAQAYVRDLEIMDILQYDTKFSSQIGMHNFKRHVAHLVHRKHVQEIPRALERFNSISETTNKQLGTFKPRASLTEVHKLRQVANAFTYDVVKVLPEILFGSTQVEAQVHGHTLQEERYKLDVPLSYWVDFYNQPILQPPHWSAVASEAADAFDATMPYHDAKLFGSAQIIRLFSVFNAIVQELQLRQVAKEDIASVVGHSRAMHSADYYLQAALTLAHHKAEATLLPLVKQLCQRASEMIKRLGTIATRIVGDGDLLRHGGLYQHEMDIPLFSGYVRVLYEHYGTLLSERCLEDCAGLLDQVLIHDVSKYAFEIPKDINSEDAQAETITKLVAAMFTDISKLFVRNITAKCYDILVARGVEDIGKRLQSDISGLKEADLNKLFDVDSFKLALEAEEKQLKTFNSTLQSAHQSFTKAVVTFSDTLQHRSASLVRLVSYKKLPFDPSLDLVAAPVAASGTSSKSSKSREERKSIKITSSKVNKKEEEAEEKTTPKENGTAAPAPAAAPKPAASVATPAPAPTPAASVQTSATEGTTEPKKVGRSTSSTPAPNASITAPAAANAPSATPAPASTATSTAPAATPATSNAKATAAPAKTAAPPAATATTAAASAIPVSNVSGSSTATTPVKSPSGLSLASDTPADPSAIPEPLVKPSAKKTPASQVQTTSPGTEAAKVIIPPNNAATKKAAFEKAQ
jgi:GTPase SAR1 family protein